VGPAGRGGYDRAAKPNVQHDKAEQGKCGKCDNRAEEQGEGAYPERGAPAPQSEGDQTGAGHYDHQDRQSREVRAHEAGSEKRSRIECQTGQGIVILYLEDRRSAEEDRNTGQEYEDCCRTQFSKMPERSLVPGVRAILREADRRRDIRIVS